MPDDYPEGLPSPDIIQFTIDVNHLISELPSLKTKDAIRTVVVVRELEGKLRQTGQMTHSLADMLALTRPRPE